MLHADHIIKLMPGRIYWKNRQGIYLGCNNQTIKDYGLTDASQFIGKSVYDFHPKEIADKIFNIDEEIMSLGEPRIVEETVKLLTGVMATLLSHKIPLYDGAQRVIGLLGVSFDISDRKHNEVELKKSKALIEEDLSKTTIYLKNIIANVPANLYWKNKEGVYLGTNENNARSAGVTVDQYIGSTLYDVYSHKYAILLDKVDNEVMSRGIPKQIEEGGPRLDGSPGVFLTQKVPLKDERGEIIGLLGISMDITDRKLAEAALQEAKEKAETANRIKTQFLATVSHELRTPLAGILGMVQALNYVDLPQTAHDYVNDIMKSSEHLLSLINDLLDITKLEAGKMQLTRSCVDLKNLVEQTVHMLIHQARLKGLNMQTFIEPEIPAYVLGDARALRQIILNLVGNAIKFTECGMITVEAHCASPIDQNVVIDITVTDTGIGIPPEKIGTIFERFTQVDSSFTRRYGGAGLGLSLCKSYLELMNGRIQVESDLGRGSKFTCTIPFVVQEEISLPQVTETITPIAKSQQVLLVEDNLVIQKVHRMFLEELGFKVDIVESGQCALEKMMHRHPYQIIFLDVGLPDMSGLEVTRLVRDYERKYKLSAVPIIALTAFDHPEDHAHCLNVGMTDVLVKPIGLKQLHEVLKIL